MHLPEGKSEAIAKWASAKAEIEAVVLFGSYAKGTATAESDVDVAVKIHEAWRPLVMYITDGEDWQSELRDLTGMEVNIELMHETEAPRAYSFIQHCYVVLYKASTEKSGR
jgi:predicted nucleotidyltransferase